MGRETAFRELFTQLSKVGETLEALRCLLPDDPLNTEVALVQHLRESVDTLSGWLDDCFEQSKAAREDAGQSADMTRSRRALNLCQASFDQAQHTFAEELSSYEKLREIMALGARRKGVWLVWSRNVKRDLDGCRYELDQTRKALTACWQALAEQAGTTNISVQATNVGQQITAGRTELRDFEIEDVKMGGVT
jgi:hypothetical protein